jgi:hypothetical protein
MLNKPGQLRGTGLLESRSISQKKNPAFMEPEGSISNSQEAVIGQ